MSDLRLRFFVSPYFPPSTLAGVHRARHLAKHLPEAGWTPIVLCVDPLHHEEQLDPALAALVPEGIEVLKARAVPARFTRGFGVGDIGLRSWPFFRNALMRLLSTRPIGAVLITGSPYYQMLLAAGIRRRFAVPVVLDFQDPWVSAWGTKQPSISKAGLAHRIAGLLEPQALRAANFITSVSETQNAEMRERYPWLDAGRMAAIPIGGDPDDFLALRKLPHMKELLDETPDCFHLSYVGTFLPRSGRSDPNPIPRLRPTTLDRTRARRTNSTEFHRNKQSAKAILPPAAFVQSQRPKESLKWCARCRSVSLFTRSQLARALQWIAADRVGRIPLYGVQDLSGADERQALFSLFHRASSAHAILAAAGGGRAFAFESTDELASLEAPLAEALRTLACAPEAFGAADPATYARYHANAIARQFGEYLRSSRRGTCSLKGRKSSIMRLAVVTSHPIQYHAPLFRELARQIDLTVFFAHRARPSTRPMPASGLDSIGTSIFFPGTSRLPAQCRKRPGVDQFLAATPQR